MKTVLLVGLGLVAAGTALAQERSAGQAYDAQVNWGVLATKIDQVSNQNKALASSMAVLQAGLDSLNAKMTAVASCGAQQKLWNGTGCVAVASTVQTGTAAGGGGYGGSSHVVNVVFPKAFASAPKVSLSLAGFAGHTTGSAACNSAFSASVPALSNVTRTGFTLTFPKPPRQGGGGHDNDSCGAYGTPTSVTWTAVGV